MTQRTSTTTSGVAVIASTLAEVLHLGRKALVVPRPGPSAEQQMRCRLFEQRNLIDVLYREQRSSQTLAERLLLDLERSVNPSHDGVVDTRGLHVVAALLLNAAPFIPSPRTPGTLTWIRRRSFCAPRWRGPKRW